MGNAFRKRQPEKRGSGIICQNVFGLRLLCTFWALLYIPAVAEAGELAVKGYLPPTASAVSFHPMPPPPDTKVSFLETRQSHNAKNAWTLHLDKDVIDRPELSRWLKQWSSPRGLRKLQIALERWQPYRRSVQKILRDSKLPWEIVAIPIVESNWKIDAISSSGATGPWQFMEQSARGRNLRINQWQDERRNVWRATQAALEELSFNYSLFSDWSLAIASYNAGPTRMRNLIKESGLNNFWELLDAGLLPLETAEYVPQVIAVAWIISNAGRFGLPLVWEISPQWGTVEVRNPTLLSYISASTDLELATLKMINRELVFPITPPSSSSEPYLLMVPAEKVSTVKKWFEKAEGREPERFWRYAIKLGDTLSEIAKNNQVSLNRLLKYNSNIQAENLIPGKHVYIPAKPGATIPPPNMEREEIPDWDAIYRVREGDTLWSISRRANTTPEKMAWVNGMRVESLLNIGSPLKVPYSLNPSPLKPLPTPVDLLVCPDVPANPLESDNKRNVP